MVKNNTTLQDIARNSAVTANEIGLLLNAGISSLLVEGSTDQIFYRNFVLKGKYAVRCPDPTGRDNGKARVIELLKILEDRKFSGMLAIVDADFEILEGNTPFSPNLLFTDAHDLEAMLINSPALDKILGEYGSENKISAFRKDIRATLLESATIIGYLRWASLKKNYALRFEGLAFEKFVDKTNLMLDIGNLIKTVKNHSQKLALLDQEIQESLDSVKSDLHDKWQVCCGHDLVCILAVGLRKTVGTNNPSTVEPDILEMGLRLAYAHAYFYKTLLYKAIENWESQHKPFKILSPAN